MYVYVLMNFIHQSIFTIFLSKTGLPKSIFVVYYIEKERRKTMYFSREDTYDEDDILEMEYEEYMNEKYNMEYMQIERESMPVELIKEAIEARDEAEANGLYDEHLTAEQEMTLHQAISSLSELAKETNSSLSDLLKMGGYTEVK